MNQFYEVTCSSSRKGIDELPADAREMHFENRDIDAYWVKDIDED